MWNLAPAKRKLMPRGVSPSKFLPVRSSSMPALSHCQKGLVGQMNEGVNE